MLSIHTAKFSVVYEGRNKIWYQCMELIEQRPLFGTLAYETMKEIHVDV